MIEQFTIDDTTCRYSEVLDINEKDGFKKAPKGFENLLALEEIVDTTLTYYVKSSDQATQLLKKCAKLMNENKWDSLKSYLELFGKKSLTF
jgi:hypothetical protein